MEKAVLLFLSVLIVILLWMLRRQSRSLHPRSPSPRPARGRGPGKEKLEVKVCLLCGAKLPPGGAIRTALFPPDGKEGRPMEIYGCRRCTPAPPAPRGLAAPPRCPMCQAALEPGEGVYARQFEKPGRKQVTILGCPRCLRRG